MVISELLPAGARYMSMIKYESLGLSISGYHRSVDHGAHGADST